MAPRRKHIKKKNMHTHTHQYLCSLHGLTRPLPWPGDTARSAIVAAAPVAHTRSQPARKVGGSSTRLFIHNIHADVEVHTLQCITQCHLRFGSLSGTQRKSSSSNLNQFESKADTTVSSKSHVYRVIMAV